MLIEEASIPVILLALGKLSAKARLPGKDSVDYPELRLLYLPPSEGKAKGKVVLDQSCDWPKLDNTTVMSIPICCEMETPELSASVELPSRHRSW